MAKAKKQNKRNTKAFKKNRKARQSRPRPNPFQVTVNGSMGNSSIEAKFADADRQGADCVMDITGSRLVTYYKENGQWVKQPNQFV